MSKNKLPDEFFGATSVLNILRSSGKSRPPSDFPLLHYYLERNGIHPFIKNYNENTLNHVSFLEDFMPMVKEVIHERTSIDEKLNVDTEYLVCQLDNGYIAEINIGYHTLDSFELTIQDILRQLAKKDNTALVAGLTLYCPPPTSSLYNKMLEMDIFALVKKHRLDKNTTSSCIGMICAEDGEYYMKDFYIKKEYKISEGDLHYGPGFVEFHEKLLSRFNSDTKGLVLFHGLPGTGKTFYIRSLMKDLIAGGKYVIYLPANMMDSMVDPNMMTFLSNTAMEQSESGKSCVFLLEDAEPLLVSRKSDNRSSGITNLLNLTDGLLNDMLSIQVIATFNTELSNIDEALLRPERLIARKEFKALKKADAQVLADKLGIDKKIEKDSTLAEIYSQSKKNEILVHEYNQDAKKIGFKK